MKLNVLLMLSLSLLMGAVVYATTDKPNIVIIYGDDVGYGDVGVYGSKLIPTPNIDRLAREGLRFTDGHCSSSTCSPSCFSMLTGVYAFRKKNPGELYHSVDDPGEARNLVDQHLEVAEAMAQELKAMVEADGVR